MLAPTPAKMIAVKHLILPGYEHARVNALAGRETISEFLERSQWVFKAPTICVINGQPVLRKDWAETLILEDDEIIFLTRPWGPGSGRGGKLMQVLGLVAVIALAAFAVWAAPAIAGAIGFGGNAFAQQLVQGAIILGGTLLLSTVFFPKAGGQNQDSTNPLYSLSATGNTAKPLQPIPTTYGRLKWFPDYAAMPWAEYDGNDQYLNILLSLGLGTYSVNHIYVDDTILWDSATGVAAPFAGNVTLQFCDPGVEVTLFPSNVHTTAEVNGQELPITGDPVGAFAISEPGTTTKSIAVDFAMPNGLYFVRSEDGSPGPLSVVVVGRYTPIDDVGNPTGPAVVFLNETFTASSTQPLRYTRKVDVPEGRYSVELNRNPVIQNSSNIDSVVWLSARAFLTGPTSYQNVSTLAIRIKANEQLSATSAKKFGVLATRYLQVWNGTAFASTLTQNPIWAFYDAATNDVYGAGHDPSKIDLQALVTQANACDTRGDTFNFTFSQAQPVPNAFDTILKVARCKHRWAGDVLTIVRDEEVALPQMLLTDRQIVRGSLSLNYVFNDDQQSDAVIVEYFDESFWMASEVQYPPNSDNFTSVNPTRIQLDGVTNRNHATREAAFWYLQAFYRRINVTLNTEHDGRLLGVGSVVRVQSELPQSWGSSGIVVSQNGTVVQVSPAPTWDAGQAYVNFRSKTGKPFGPIKVSRGVSDEFLVLDATDLATVEGQTGLTITEAFDRMPAAEEPTYDFGIGTATSKTCIVLSGRPQNDQVQLNLVVDDPRVHNGDLTGIPVAPVVPATTDPRRPTIIGLVANVTQGTSEPILAASWFTSAGATSYTADISYDGGSTWFHVYDGTAQNFSCVVNRADIRLRVAAIGIQHGPYAFVDLTAPDVQTKLDGGLKDFIYNWLDQAQQQIDAMAAIIANSGVEQDAANWLDKKANRKDARTTLTQQFNNAQALIDQNSTAIADQEGAFAQLQTTVTAQLNSQQASITQNSTALTTLNNSFASYTTTTNATFGTLSASVTQNQSALATINGSLIAQWTVTLDAGGRVSGIKAFNDGRTSAFQILADVFLVSVPSVNGGIPVTVFGTGFVNGQPTVVMKNTMIGDAQISTAKIADLSVTNAKIGTAAVTNAKIGNLAVDTLNVAGNAITVPAVATRSDQITGQVAACISASLNFTAPAGTAVTVMVFCKLQVGYPNGATSNEYTLFLTDNHNVLHVLDDASGQTIDYTVSLAGAVTMIASGGLDKVFSQVNVSAQSSIVAARSLFLQLAKR